MFGLKECYDVIYIFCVLDYLLIFVLKNKEYKNVNKQSHMFLQTLKNHIV
jgi:hypothetical protein